MTAVVSARRIGACLVVWIILFSASLHAGTLQALTGHVPAITKQLRPLRRLEETNVLRLAIGLPLRHPAELDKFLRDLYDPGSPTFRHYLEPSEFAAQFGPSETDYLAVMAFAASNHLSVTRRDPNHALLDVQGAVPDIEKAFHLKLQVYRHPTENREFFAPDGEPQMDLAVPVLHIAGLDNFAAPHSNAHAAPAAGPRPQSGSAPSGNYAGPDFRAAYAPNLTNQGTGQSVGLVEFAGYLASDITRYETNFSLPNVTLSNVLIDGMMVANNDSGVETPLDIEMAISMAPGLSQVYVYYGALLDDILQSIATANVAKQVSSSWTFVSVDATAVQYFEEMAAQGQSFFNSSGDADGDSIASAVPAPVDLPYLTSVGGTLLSTTGKAGSWVSETTWNNNNGVGTGGGVSPTYPLPIWQQGFSMDANGGSAYYRNFPDVAMVAQNIWVYFAGGASGSFGGTSCSAPLWAGYMALINQQAALDGQPPVGFLNPSLYALARSSYSTSFHDITTGDNTSPNSPTKFFAKPGYDLCTGLGTPRVTLVNNIASAPVNPLLVTPVNGLVFAGAQGGPFNPATNVLNLANIGGSAIGWSVANTSSWFSISPSAGIIQPNSSNSIAVAATPAANSLPNGFYSAALTITNQTNALTLNRMIWLIIGTGKIWDTGGTGGPPVDGSGTWADATSSNATTHWLSGSGNTYWTNSAADYAVFGSGIGAPGIVTLGSPITASGLNFSTVGQGNYTIAGGSNTLTMLGNIMAFNSATVSANIALGAPAAFLAAVNQTLNISGTVSGASSNSLTILGPGTVNWTGQNNAGLASAVTGPVTVASGTLALNGGGSAYGTLGYPMGIVVSNGATLELLGSNDISGPAGLPADITLYGGALTDLGLNQSVKNIFLNGGAVSGAGDPNLGSFALGGDCFANTNSTISAQNILTSASSTFWAAPGAALTFSGSMIGGGPLNFAGPGTLLLTGTNASSGLTAVKGGLMLVNGSISGGGPVTVSGGALGGSGLIGGPVTVQATGELLTSPNTITNLAFGSSLVLNSGSASFLKVSAAQATNDQLVVAGSLTLGGILDITNVAGTLVAGQTFTVFTGPSVSGSFSGVTPPPGPGLVWNTNLLASKGILGVQASQGAALSNLSLQGTNLVFLATGGPPSSPFHIVAATNLTLPLSNWIPVWSNTFDGNGNGPALSNVINPALPQEYFDVVVP